MPQTNFFGTGRKFYMLEDGSDFYDLDIDASTISDLPPPGDGALKAWELERVAYLLSQAPVARTTVKYIDPVDGDNGDAGTIEAPWADFTNVSWTDDYAVMLKAGTVLRKTTEILVTTKDNTISRYGDGPNPVISAFDTPVTTGASWTADTGTTYYRTRAGASAVGAFREAYDRQRAYVRCSTVTECRLIKGSYFHDTGAARLYVNSYDGANLTTAGLPYTFEICGVVADDGIHWTTASSGSFRVHGITVEGFGSKDTSSQTSEYAFHSEQTGTGLFVCTDCEGFYSNNHNFGHTAAGSGGTALFMGCKAAWMNFQGTCYVGYSGTGDNELYVVGCEAWGGTLPRNTAGTWSYANGVSGSDFYTAHTGSGSCDLVYVSGCTVKPNQFGLGSIGTAANVPDWSTDVSLCRCYHVDCRYECRTPSALDMNLVVSAGRPGTATRGLQPINFKEKALVAHVNCFYEALPVWETTNDVVGSIDIVEGLFINTTFVVDGSWVAHGDTSGAWARGFVRYMGNLEGRFYNCHIEIVEPHKINCGLSAQCAYQNTLTDNNVDDDFYLYDSIVQMRCPNGTAYLGCGNNRRRSDGAVNATAKVKNVVTNVPPSTDTYRGDDQCVNVVRAHVAVGHVPSIGEFDAAQVALPGGSLYVGHDRYWRARRSGTSAIGPVEAA